jgi:hypothetical protein
LSRRENKKTCSFFTESETKASNHSYQEEEEEDDDEEEEEERRALKIGVEVAMAKKGTRKERRQELRAVRLLLHIRIFGCRKSSNGYLWMEEIIQRVFVDAGSHPKVISGWRKAWKGYL